jgi:hypothetical protein
MKDKFGFIFYFWLLRSIKYPHTYSFLKHESFLLKLHDKDSVLRMYSGDTMPSGVFP